MGAQRGRRERTGLRHIPPSLYRNQHGGETGWEQPTSATRRRGGGGGRSYGLHPNPVGTPIQGGLWELSAHQLRQSPTRGNHGQRGVERVVVWPRGHDLPSLQDTDQEGTVSLCRDLGKIAACGAGLTVELRAVHCLSGGDPTKSSTCHCIPHNTKADWEEARRLGSRLTHDVGGGYFAQLRAIPHRRLKRGDQVAQGKDLS